MTAVSILINIVMKKYFLHQLEHQRTPGYQPVTKITPVLNVLPIMQHSFLLINTLYHSNSPHVLKNYVATFSKNNKPAYTELISKNMSKDSTPVPFETLKEWIEDPLFDRLINSSSHEEMNFLKAEHRCFIFEEFAKATASQYSRQEDFGTLAVHIQHPGQVFPLHVDRVRHVETVDQVKSLQSNSSHKRFIIFMEDQQPGQMFQMDLAHINWKAGDMITWNPRDTMHSTANAGYWPRMIIRLDINKKYLQDHLS